MDPRTVSNILDWTNFFLRV